MGAYTLSYTPPWMERPFRFKLDEAGSILQIKLSGSKELVFYKTGANFAAVQTKKMILREILTGNLIRQIIENPTEGLLISANISLHQGSVEKFQRISKDKKTISAVHIDCVESKQEYKVDCHINLNKEKDNFTRIFSRQNNRVRNFRNFELVESVQSKAMINNKKHIEI